jgi:dolichyl-diphosphooligosaccharide--protein glycosyltransferase
MEAAQEYVQTDSTSQIGGLQGIPTEQVPALEHYRLVHASEERSQVGPWVKTFERVDGATVEGTGPANTTVTASVEMRIPTQNTTFTYYQQVQTGEDGSFTMTVPYSTTGYDEFGPESGHTDVSVRATGPYQFSAIEQGEGLSQTVYNGTATVTEGQVLGEDDSTVTVDLGEGTTIEPQGNQTGDASNTTAGNGTASNGTDTTGGNETTGTATNGTNATGSNETNASALVAPSTVGRVA